MAVVFTAGVLPLAALIAVGVTMLPLDQQLTNPSATTPSGPLVVQMALDDDHQRSSITSQPPPPGLPVTGPA